MSINENYISADTLNAASITGEVGTEDSYGEIIGEINTEGLLGGVEVQGVSITINQEIPIATTSRLGGVIVGDHLSVTEQGRLSVDVAQSVEGDNTNPISAAAVYMEVGNINALLQTIQERGGMNE